MIIAFTATGWEDYTSWAGEAKILRRLNRLIDETARDPEAGIGRPERLAHNLSGFWSRRITDEHRLIYRVENVTLTIIAARGHYED